MWRRKLSDTEACNRQGNEACFEGIIKADKTIAEIC